MTNDTKNNLPNFDNIDFIRFLHNEILKEAFKMMMEGLPGDSKVKAGKTLEKPQELAKKTNATAEEKNWPISALDLWAQRNFLENRHLRMWGEATPMVGMLGDIADTELKIEKQRPSQIGAENSRPPLSEKDIELLRELLRKAKA